MRERVGRRTWLATLLALTSLGTATLVWTEIYLYSRNSLAVNGRWISTKAELQMGVHGSSDFLHTRHALSGNSLDLGEWHGFNEITLNEVVSLRSIRARFLLVPGAYLIATFNRSLQGFSGVRLSRSPSFPSMYFQASHQGRFQSKKPLSLGRLADGWHDLEIQFEGEKWGLRIDGHLVDEIEESPLEAQIVGFRSGLRSARLDDIEIETAEGHVVREGFRNRSHRGRALLAHAGTLALLCSLPILARCLRGGRKPRSSDWLAFGMVGFTLAAVGMIYLLFDVYYWSTHR